MGFSITGSSLFATYIIYLVISIGLTWWVGRTLFKNGQIFLNDVFYGNEPLARSVNHLLVVGFYLINFGYISLALRIGYSVTIWSEGVEALSEKIGLVSLVLGVMHFFNLYILTRLRNRSLLRHAPPPVSPDVPPPPATKPDLPPLFRGA